MNKFKMTKSKLAPVALFVYGRPIHTQRTLDALLLNEEALSTDLIVYSDGAKNNNDINDVTQVRNIIKETTGFRSVTLIERKTNLGLAENIISGVSEVCEKYGMVIVLEDDIVISSYFLKFMNSALNEYKDTKQVWHISGWNYPLEISNDLPDTFFWRVMNCWGWATWSDRWQYFEKNPQKLVNTWNKYDINRFNLDGSHNFWSQVTANYNEKLNTWAIFWYATIFENNGLCLNPTQSYVSNIGNDGSGENCGSIDIYKSELNQKTEPNWPDILEENKIIVNKIKKFYYLTGPFILPRIIRKLKRVFLS